jgi:hypothetical protein
MAGRLKDTPQVTSKSGLDIFLPEYPKNSTIISIIVDSTKSAGITGI